MLHLLLIAIISILFGCSTTPSKTEAPILERYQSSQSYGSIAIELDTTSIGVARSTSFKNMVEVYASKRAVPIALPPDAPDSVIRISLGNESGYSAALYYRGDYRDQLKFEALDEPGAELIIDELLLLWHPPASKMRSPVPQFSLQPTSYQVKKLGFMKLMVDSKEFDNMNIGHQAWHQLDSRTPTFSWESFPRDTDIAVGLTASDFKNVHYQFMFTAAAGALVGFYGHPESVITAENLSEPNFTIKDKLPFCRQYIWTVRAVFELNGVPRQTEWGGAYNLYPSMQEKPWYARRNLQRGLAARFHQSSYYYTVRTPKNPFADECVYR